MPGRNPRLVAIAEGSLPPTPVHWERTREGLDGESPDRPGGSRHGSSPRYSLRALRDAAARPASRPKKVASPMQVPLA